MRIKILLLSLVFVMSFSFTACNSSDSKSSTTAITEQSQQVKTVQYVGSVNSNIYHKPNCEWAQKINSGNLVQFSSRKEAQDMNYRPCKVCNP